jgi:nucleoside-specific outer membrane channel protein Tsx
VLDEFHQPRGAIVKNYAVSKRTSLRIGAAAVAVAGAFALAGAPAHAENVYLEHVWANQVNVHYQANPPGCEADPGLYCAVLGQINAGDYYIYCQQFGESETYDGYQSDYWSLVDTPVGTGYVSNVFFVGPAQLPGVPSCI